MKILEISGCNLASLKGPFCLALDRAPFSRGELFAIRGATGSGKSTLIDAMCLALYGCTPRLDGSGGPRVGAGGQDPDDPDRVAAADPRGILQRGTGEGWAEVRFRGVDGGGWRARWSVARARKAAGGRLQKPAMELENLADGSVARGNKTEVLDLIRAKVGLSFDQFRRSVLLAQGEFAAFTRAGKDERAALLEAMTGTGIYADLSMAAYRRCATEEQQARDLAAQLGALGVLGAEDRDRLLERIQDGAGRIGAQERQRAEVRRDLAWHERDDDLGRRAQAAEGGAAATQAAWDGAGTRRERLRALDSAQFLQPLRARLDAARAARSALALQIAEQAAGLPAQEQDAQSKAAAAAAADQERAAAAEAIRAAKPELDQARALDARLGPAQDQVSAAAEEHARARTAARAAAVELERAEQQEACLARDLASLDGALAASQPIQALARTWERVDQDIQAYAGTWGALAEAAKRLDRLRGQAGELAGQRAALAARQEQLAAGARVRQAELDGLDRSLAAQPPAALAEAREGLQAALDRSRAAVALLERFQVRLGLQRKAEAAAQAQAEARERGEAAARRAEAGLEAMQSGLAEARQAAQLARAALDLADRRRLLVPGEPCPLCGAPEHPWAEGSPLQGLLAAQEERVRQLEAGQVALEGQRAAGRAQAGLAARAETEARAEGARLATEVLGDQSAWLELRARLTGLPEDGRLEASAEAARQLTLDLQDRLAAAVQRERAAAALSARKDALAQAARADEDRRGELQRQAADLDRQAQEAALAEAQFARDLSHHQEALSRLVAALEPSLGTALGAGAMADLEQDPEAVRTGLAGQVRLRLEAEAGAARLGAQRAELALERQGLHSAADAARTAAAAAAGQLALAERQRDQLQAQRAELCAGRAVADRERQLEQRRADAEQAQARCQAAARAAAQDLAARRNTIATLDGQLRLAQTEAGDAERAWAEGVVRWGGEPAELDGLLAWTFAAIQTERQALQELDSTRASALAVLQTLRQALDQHRAADRPERGREESQSLDRDLGAALDQLKADLGGARALLAQDDQARAAAGEIQAAIAGQGAAVKLWKEMSGLIGSASGQLFRSFAQSLTLEALVQFANQQMQLLKPRYRLERVPGYEMDLQIVDQDMGDEVRPVTSLSGGETFLVSLALALGLSCLSATGTAIESLFIDEGFGALDGETLETALAALDVLQDQGRQVGIISHVDSLASCIPVQILVERLGGGRSRVLAPQPGPATAVAVTT